MGRRRATSQSFPMEQYGSGDADSSLIPPMPMDPELQRIMAEDRRRKAKRRRQVTIAISITAIISFALLAVAGATVLVIYFRRPEVNVTLREPSEADDPLIVAEELKRVNCYPEQDGSPYEPWAISKADCEKRGCIYRRTRATQNMPVCFIPSSIGYRQADMRQRDVPHRTTEYFLRRLTPGGIFGPLVDSVKLSVTELSEAIVRIHVAPERPDGGSWAGQPPFDLEKENLLNTGSTFFSPDPDLKPRYKFDVLNDNPFSFRVARAPPTEQHSTTHHDTPVLWSTDIGGMIVTGDYIQIAGLLPRDSRVYGIGEHRHEILRRDHKLMAQTWSLFSRFQPPDWMPESHLYGAHPFVMVVDPNGLTHGILFYNAAPAEITVNPYPSITWRSVAGVIDMYLFVGPTPDSVIQQYTQLVGRPALPPRWFLDLHVSFSGVENLADLERSVVDFDSKHLNWGTMSVRQDNSNNLRYDTSGAFDEMLARWRRSRYNTNKQHLSYSLLPFVSTNARGGQAIPNEVIIGRAVENAIKQLSCVSSGDASKQNYYLLRQQEQSGLQQIFAFWDPLSKDIVNVLNRYLSQRWRVTDFSTIELLENQPYVNFRDKNVTTSNCLAYELPYTTRAGYFQFASSSTLSRATVCALSLHRDCTVPHIDVHNAYGLLMSRAVSESWVRVLGQARLALSRRSNVAPIMSSSTFPGYGRYGGHWLGQTAATWMSMTFSIISMLEFNWFGIPLVGDWICGEEGPGTLDLCSLWAKLAAFQPLIRLDHNPKSRPGFHSLLNESSFVTTLNRSLIFRKHLTPYLFSQLYEFSQFGVPFWKPLFHISPADPILFNEFQSFMVGDGLLVAPVLAPIALDGAARVQLVSHFKWLHLKTNREYDFCRSSENNARIARPVKSIQQEGPESYMYLKSGSVVPVDTEMLTTLNMTVPPDTRGRKLTFIDYGALHISLLVSEDCDYRKIKGRPLARGSFFWEGGMNATSSVHVTFTLSQYYTLEGRMTFQPPRVLHSHLPPNVPRPPALPWPFEVVIDHILFLGIDASRLVDVRYNGYYKTLSTSNEVKVDIKQASNGDTAISTHRESIAIHYPDKKILIAARVMIPVSEGDFSVVLVPRSRHTQ